MTMTARSRQWWIAVLLMAVGIQGLPIPHTASAQEASPFVKLTGRWLGEGRFGTKDGKTENVKCRVTYVVTEGGHHVRQTIRCATEGTSVEVQSQVADEAGVLKGTWKELSRDMSGELSGSVTATGFKVNIRGSDLNANMDIIVKDNRQIIEIQFMSTTLVGLTLVLTKG